MKIRFIFSRGSRLPRFPAWVSNAPTSAKCDAPSRPTRIRIDLGDGIGDDLSDDLRDLLDGLDVAAGIDRGVRRAPTAFRANSVATIPGMTSVT